MKQEVSKTKPYTPSFEEATSNQNPFSSCVSSNGRYDKLATGGTTAILNTFEHHILIKNPKASPDFPGYPSFFWSKRTTKTVESSGTCVPSRSRKPSPVDATPMRFGVKQKNVCSECHPTLACLDSSSPSVVD